MELKKINACYNTHTLINWEWSTPSVLYFYVMKTFSCTAFLDLYF